MVLNCSGDISSLLNNNNKAIFSQDVDLSVFKPECFAAGLVLTAFPSFACICIFSHL